MYIFYFLNRIIKVFLIKFIALQLHLTIRLDGAAH